MGKYIGLLILVAALHRSQAAPPTEHYSLNTEAHPVEPGEFARRQARAANAATQELLRFKVAIPHAVRSNAELAPLARPLEALPAAKPSVFEGRGDYVRIVIVLLCMGLLTVRILWRDKHAARIRALCGGYLSDGTEVAKYQMPDWFAPQSQDPSDGASFLVGEEEDSPKTEEGMPEPLAEYFNWAPKHLAQIREVLRSLGGQMPDEDRQKTLAALYELVTQLQSKSTPWALRPAWQMSSSLELLVKRIAEKPKNATPSVMRTVASAVDLLHELCVPGIRPELVTEPPVRILAVDDEPLCRRALDFALQKAHFNPDLAETGEQAVAMAAACAYDVIFMDIQMPGIDGLTACQQIREQEKNSLTPVIFVTVQSDFQTRAHSTLKGGTELIAKPYLMFELTVKALTFAMRKRLSLQKTAKNPLVTQNLLARTTDPAAAPATLTASSQAGVDSDVTRVIEPSSAAGKLAPSATAMAEQSIITKGNDNQKLSNSFFATAPEYLAAMRGVFEETSTATDQEVRQANLSSVHLGVHTLAASAKLRQLPIAATVSAALEALLKRLSQNPKTVNSSTLHTVSDAFGLLEHLCVAGVEEKLRSFPPIQILVVDDEPLARRAVVGALQLAFEKPDSAEHGAAALVRAAQKSYDIIFTDIDMPAMDGYEFCRLIRSSGSHRDVPVVFITTHIDAASREAAARSGGSDFIGKPFLPIEITVKALTFAWDKRLRDINSSASTAGPGSSATSTNPTSEEAGVSVPA
ncbi:MAG TPA: response regulator [Methylomirabilota bacterium]|nr:response regulator [Methylomirabilota bacterium]